jgi:hypothetical protein
MKSLESGVSESGAGRNLSLTRDSGLRDSRLVLTGCRPRARRPRRRSRRSASGAPRPSCSARSGGR